MTKIKTRPMRYQQITAVRVASFHLKYFVYMYHGFIVLCSLASAAKTERKKPTFTSYLPHLPFQLGLPRLVTRCLHVNVCYFIPKFLFPIALTTYSMSPAGHCAYRPEMWFPRRMRRHAFSLFVLLLSKSLRIAVMTHNKPLHLTCPGL